ncbi:hypothetical protein GBA52_025082 [Prunus armeniaca]|nr:hypothetical protein GBA52_025082 [Prunus armeniaca]
MEELLRAWLNDQRKLDGYALILGNTVFFSKQWHVCLSLESDVVLVLHFEFALDLFILLASSELSLVPSNSHKH